jgi:hypothetical protein
LKWLSSMWIPRFLAKKISGDTIICCIEMVKPELLKDLDPCPDDFIIRSSFPYRVRSVRKGLTRPRLSDRSQAYEHSQDFWASVINISNNKAIVNVTLWVLKSTRIVSIYHYRPLQESGWVTKTFYLTNPRLGINHGSACSDRPRAGLVRIKLDEEGVICLC